MRDSLMTLLRIVVLVALAAPSVGLAAELKLRKPAAAEIGQQVTCPVMNMQFKVAKDTPTVDYKGKAYHFCCEHCIKDFQKAPDKYAAAATAAASVRKPTAEEVGKSVKCAVQGTEFDVTAETKVIDYQGKPHYFCCEHCVAEFQAKPQKYAAK